MRSNHERSTTGSREGRNTYDRRTALRLAGGGLAAGLAGCAGRLGSGTENTLESQLASVRSETEQYADPTAALEAGFKLTGPVAPGQGWHFVNPKRVETAAKEGLDRSSPQVLTYDREMNLVAVEWAVPTGAVDDQPDLFDDGDASATETWHTHESFTHVLATGDGTATPPPELGFDTMATNDNWAAFRPPNTELSPGDEIALKWGVESPDADEGGETRVVDLAQTHPPLMTLHVWVHSDNPKGVFHPTHPDVAGGGGHDHDH
ncbi:MAG: hypothetical protein ABEI75_00625 [Halobaculum sp.]